MNKFLIIKMKKQGISNSKIAKQEGIDRKTVASIWQEYLNLQKQIVNNQSHENHDEQYIIENLMNSTYDISNRKKRKLTLNVTNRINELLKGEDEKNLLLGLSHKQKLSATAIHQILLDENYDIGLSSVTTYIRNYKKHKDVYIRQNYEYAQRLEYDFGEVKLIIDGVKTRLYIAVLASPASDFRWAYLYKTQDQNVFLDSHVKFFEMVGGSYKEVVYDNMKNVVSKFLGHNEKRLNEKLINLALYYDFDINVTNCFSGNEKGFVEGSVKIIRNKIFSKKYIFKSLDVAREYLNKELENLNVDSKINEEKKVLNRYRAPLDLAIISLNKVDKYSCIRIENNYYSVPDYLLDKQVTVKNYMDKILIYSNHKFVCQHEKIDGIGQYKLELDHFLNTFKKKPGALKNSEVLKSYPQLKAIYEEYYKLNTKKFIEILLNNRGLNSKELLNILEKGINNTTNSTNIEEEIYKKSKTQLYKLSELLKIGEL